MIATYASMLIQGEVDFKLLGNVYRHKEAIPEASVKRLLKYKETQNKVNEQLQLQLSSNNVTLDYLIKERKSVLEDVKTDEDVKGKDKYNILLDTIKGFEDMYNMREQIKETKHITETVSYKELLANGDQKAIKLEKSEETPLNKKDVKGGDIPKSENVKEAKNEENNGAKV